MCAARTIPDAIALAEDAKRAIVDILATGSTRPTDLLARLDENYTDFQLKEALLNLLREGTVLMTSDRYLELASR